MGRIIAIIMPLFVGIIFSAAGIFIALQTAVPTYLSWSSTRNYIPVEARLLEVGGTDSSTAAVYTYRIDGRTFTSNKLYHTTFSDNIGSYHVDLQERLRFHKAKSYPVTVWISPDNPENAILDNSMRWGLFAFMTGFCLIFVLAGLFIVYACFSKKKAKTKDKREQSGVGSLHFQKRKGWQTKHIRSSAKSSIGFFWAFALLWNAISFPAAIAVFDEIVRGDYAVLLVYLFPLVGTFLLFKALHTTLEYKRFGVVEFTMDPYPGAIGGHVGGTIRLKKLTSEHINSKFNVELQCIYTYVSGSGKNRSRKENIVWAEEGNSRASMLAKGLQLEFRFTVPDNLPEADIEQKGKYHFWRLKVSGDLPGVDLSRSYNIPVFKTGKTSFHARHDISEQVAEQSIQESAEVEAAIARQDFKTAGLSRNISLKTEGRELRMVFPMFRNKILTIFALIFGIGFSAATIAINSEFSVSSLFQFGIALFSLPFAAIGLIGLISGIYLLLNRLHVSIKDVSITILRTLFILPIYFKKIEKYQVKDLTLKKTGSMGQGTRKIDFYEIRILSADGKNITIADSIGGRDTAKHFKEYLLQRIRMS